MFRHLISLSTAALLAIGGAASAQQTEEATPPTLDLGTPVTDGPQLGERYARETFGDWDLACIKTEAEVDPCSMLQVLSDGDGNPTAEVSIFRLEGGGQAVAGGSIIVPLETFLPAQVILSVDGGQAKRYNYSFCNPLGCVAQVGFTEADIAQFRAGNAAVITIVPAPAPDQKVQLTMSLSGFTAAYNEVDTVPAN
jgi:invasion protein IalB